MMINYLGRRIIGSIFSNYNPKQTQTTFRIFAGLFKFWELFSDPLKIHQETTQSQTQSRSHAATGGGGKGELLNPEQGVD